MLKFRIRHFFVFSLLLLLPLSGSGCNLFTKSALGKLGISIPSLVKHSPENHPEKMKDSRYGSDDYPDFDIDSPGQNHSNQNLLGQNYDSLRGQQPDSPYSGVSFESTASLATVGTPSGEVFEPVVPFNGLPPLEQFDSSPWDNPLNDFPDLEQWMEDDKSISLSDSEQKSKDAKREAKYQKMLESSAQKNPNKPWLNPLPHPYGLFSYREISPTMGLGGEFDENMFDPITGKPQAEIELYEWEKSNDKSFDWTKFDPVNMVSNIRTWMGMGPDEKKAAALMESGYAIMRSNQDFKNKEKNIDAAKFFEKAAVRWPDSVLEEDALFLAGECYYFSDVYAPAMKNYSKLAMKHRSTKHMDTSMMRLFRIGRYWERCAEQGVSFVNFRDKTRPKVDTFGHMKKTYEAIFTCDPMGPFGDKAVMALAGAYMRKGQNQGDSQYVEAAALYAALPDINAKSEYLLEAKKFELYAKSMAYVGAEYDSKALDESLRLAESTIRQYGSELGEEKENILDLQEALTSQKADRLYQSGIFYEKKKMYSTARYHYERLMSDHPASPRYAEVQQRHAKIQNLEDMDDNIKWLRNALTFPKKRIPSDTQPITGQEQIQISTSNSESVNR